MKELCISIDVSKGESHVGSFIDSMTIYHKVFTIKHDLKGFQQIKALYDEMRINFKKKYVSSLKQQEFIIEDYKIT